MPSIIALDLIKTAMRHIGVIATGETPSAEEANDGLQALNDVLETWNLEKLAVYGQDVEVFQTVSGQAKYSVGPTGDWVTSRPTQVSAATVNYLGVKFPILPWTLSQYETAGNLNYQQIPERFVYVNDYPNGLFILYPTPFQAVYIYLESPRVLLEVATLATILDLPPGYSRALAYAVALELSTQYGSPVDVSAYARSTKALIKRANRTPMISQFDSTIAYLGTPGPDAYFPTPTPTPTPTAALKFNVKSNSQYFPVLPF